jgi:Uma2 family endonuclease
VGAADDALRAVLPAGFFVRAQMPVALDEESAPEPDLAVVAGRRSDYRAGHPASAVLVYARARVSEYWIVNLIDRVVEVYCDPGPDASAAHGWRYRSVTRLGPAATVEPVALPSARIRISDLLR